MRVLIVDDEPTARRGLKRQIGAIPGTICVGECGGREAVIAAIVERRPDVVLLDIQLGRTSAFDIIDEIGLEAMPLVVFVTANDRHALKAFEVHALDYVLKPVDPARLREALERAASLRSLQRGASLADRLEGLLARHATASPAESPPSPPPHRLTVKDGDRLSFVEVDQVEWFESSDNYIRVHSGGRAYVMRGTMHRLARRLAGHGGFVRVRRSALVNIRSVATIERFGKGAYVVHLRNGVKITASRYHQPALHRLLKGQ